MSFDTSRRGYLPHRDGPGLTQSITFRLDGALPRAVYERIKAEHAHLPDVGKRIAVAAAIERYLDAGDVESHLAQPQIAQIVESALLFFNGERYVLHAWCIMPNHVHLMMTILGDWQLKSVLHSLKSFTAKKANRILGMRGGFWQPDYFDGMVRDEADFKRSVAYIHENPVKAGLVGDATEFRWSSAWRRPSYSTCMKGLW